MLVVLCGYMRLLFSLHSTNSVGVLLPLLLVQVKRVKHSLFHYQAITMQTPFPSCFNNRSYYSRVFSERTFASGEMF